MNIKVSLKVKKGTEYEKIVEEIIEVPEDELEELNEEEREDLIREYAHGWSDNYIQVDFDEV